MKITGKKMLRSIAIFVVGAVVILIVTTLIRGDSVIELFTDPWNLPIWIGLAIIIFVNFFLFGEDDEKEEE